MRHSDREINSVADLTIALRETASSGLVWYRGQDNADWKLIPSVTRPGGNLEAELTTIKRFKQNALSYLRTRPASEWEWVFLMQHHRAPTRLLDWSESPLVALYFALMSRSYEEHPAAVWCLDPIALNNLAGHQRAFPRDVLAFGIDKQMDAYLPDNIDARVSRLNPVAAIGPRNSARMVAQAGTFTVIHAEATPIEEVGNQQHVWKLVIPATSRESLRDELKLLYINEYSLFPDLDRVALQTREILA